MPTHRRGVRCCLTELEGRVGGLGHDRTEFLVGRIVFHGGQLLVGKREFGLGSAQACCVLFESTIQEPTSVLSRLACCHVVSLCIASLCCVPKVGFEPTRPSGQRILSPPRLPFRHSGLRFSLRVERKGYWLVAKTVSKLRNV